VRVEVTQHQRADVSVRGEINRHLLTVLKLRPRDQNDLLRRGLDDAAIERNGYKSVPLPSELNDLMKKFEGKDLRGIPGFFRKDGTWRLSIGEWKDKNQTVHSFHQGYLIPVRDVRGDIAGFQIRRANVSGDEPRYIWLSSNEKEDGTSSGAPIHYRNVELARKTGQAILTEGSLKADVSGHLLNDKHALIAVAGVSSFPEDFGRRLTSQIPELRQVVIAFDADAERKPEVWKALERLSGTLQKAGLDVRELKWEEGLGKGLDDFLLKDQEHRNEVREFLKDSLASLNRGEASVANPVNRDRSRDESRPHQQEIAL
jgi:DNA primase